SGRNRTWRRRILRCFRVANGALLAACAMLAACSQAVGLKHDYALDGRIWDTRARAFVSQQELLARLPPADHRIPGEVHDNPLHHKLQRQVLDALASADRRTLAMEQFDVQHQPALDAARALGANAEALADAGQLDRKGWNWPLYEPLVRFA